MYRSRTLSLLIPLLAATGHAAPPAPPHFITAEELTGRDVGLDFISNDGKVFSGTFLNDGRAAAYRYSAKDGFQILATDLPPATEGLWTAGMSDEGKSVYGHLQYAAGGVTYLEGFVWSTKDGFKRMGQVSEGSYTVARSITGNNKVLAGQYQAEGQPASFLWTPRDGIRIYSSLFPDFPAAATSIEWISNNLRVVWATGYDNGYTTMRWTQGKSVVTYEDLPGGNDSVVLNAVTANGRLAFGASATEIGYEAVSFRSDGIVERLFSHSDFQSMASGVTPGGRLVMGNLDENLSQSEFRGSDSFFIDRQTGRLTLLSDLFSSQVPEAAGWTRMIANSISANGNTVIGEGLDPEGRFKSWVLTGVTKHITAKPARVGR